METYSFIPSASIEYLAINLVQENSAVYSEYWRTQLIQQEAVRQSYRKKVPDARLSSPPILPEG